MGVKKRKSSMPASAYVDIQRKNKNARSPNPSSVSIASQLAPSAMKNISKRTTITITIQPQPNPLPPPLLPPDPPLVLLNA